MNKKITIMILIVMSLFFTSCSLLKLNIEGNAEPLPEKTLNARLDIRTYGNSFFSKVATIDKEIDFEMTQDEEEHFLFWKVSVANAIYSTTSQVLPRAALVDTWYTVIVLNQEMKTKEAKEVFGKMQPYLEKVLEEELKEIEDLNKVYLTEELEDGSLYDLTKTFLEKNAADVKIGLLDFTGLPIFNLWKTTLELSDENLKTNGTMSDSISNLTSSMNTYSTQTPKVLEWQTHALAYKYNLNGSEIKSTLKSIEDLSIETQNFLRKNPDFLKTTIKEIDSLMNKNIKSINLILEANIKLLTKEREKFQLYITEERARTIEQVDVAVKEQIDNLFDQVIKAIKSVMVIFILFVIMIFFAPLGLGIYIGKKIGKKNK